MISLSCAHCGEKNQVDSFLNAAEKLCASCGQPMMGGKLASQEQTDGRKPWERVEEVGDRLMAGSRDIWLQTIAGINFGYGSVTLLCGLIFWVFGGMADAAAKAQRGMQHAEQVQQAATYLHIFAYVTMFLGICTIVAGFGLKMRAPWGRYLGLFVAAIAGLMVVLDIANLAVYGVHSIRHMFYLALQITYTVATFYILFRKDVIREFHPPGRTEQS
jgi:hypothetical protein